jgi:hypothetical protein
VPVVVVPSSQVIIPIPRMTKCLSLKRKNMTLFFRLSDKHFVIQTSKTTALGLTCDNCVIVAN